MNVSKLHTRFLSSKVLLSFVFFLLSFGVFAQKVTTSIDTTYIRIGEQLEYKIKVDATKDVVFPKRLKNTSQNLELLSNRIDTLKNYLESRYILTSFDSGAYKIPRQEVRIGTRKFLTDSLLVKVATVKVDTLKQGLYDIKPVKKEPVTWIDYKNHIWWGIVILSILLGILVAILLYIYRDQTVYVQPKTPYEKAVDELAELDGKQLWQNNKTKEYYVELTDILRSYIEDDLHIPALESTTDELMETIKDMRKIKRLKVDSKDVKKLANLLREADLVKFAKSKPIQTEIEEHRSLTEQLINNFKPKTTENVEQ